MSLNNLPKVTVALSALNEGANIERLLNSVLMQIEEGFILDKIVVASDGSTDNTVEIASSLDPEKILVNNYKERKGQAIRMNEIYNNLDTDILVQTDADICFETKYVIRDLVKELVSDNQVMMCAGHAEPTQGKTFTERAVRCTFDAYADFKTTLKDGHNIFSVHGCILAFRRSFVEKMRLMESGIGNDLQCYLLCVKEGYKYRYVPSALVSFRLPTSIKDHIKQNTRQHEVRRRLHNEFDEALINKEMLVPKFLFIKSTLKQALKNPIMATYIFMLNKFCYLNSKFFGKNISGEWQIADSTKTISE